MTPTHPGSALQNAFLPPDATLVAAGTGAGRWTASAVPGRTWFDLSRSVPELDRWRGSTGPRHIDFLQFDREEAGGQLAALYARRPG
ncbi:hypothetical protein [Azospirillum isscasi]|uniref:Methyltransferase n=1 Tax=Azospirillum isscasi TaxID=3053926 RepID=A0ABU0WIB9_9PROT|nr:hypothetical protein [Azospirillum isscasi]MDQ2103968.1 hypothetical protein [Azospirillum isscasi]